MKELTNLQLRAQLEQEWVELRALKADYIAQGVATAAVHQKARRYDWLIRSQGSAAKPGNSEIFNRLLYQIPAHLWSEAIDTAIAQEVQL